MKIWFSSAILSDNFIQATLSHDHIAEDVLRIGEATRIATNINAIAAFMLKPGSDSNNGARLDLSTRRPEMVLMRPCGELRMAF